MSDLIRRNDAVEAIEFEKVYMTAYKGSSNGYVSEGNPLKQYNKGLDDAIKAVNSLPSTEPERRWIPFTMREVTAEEKEVYPEWDSILDCKLPDDGEEILVSNGKYVWLDTFINDCDGCYLDGGDDVEGLAWQPLPKPWRGE